MNYRDLALHLTTLIGNYSEYQQGFQSLYAAFINKSEEEKNEYDIALTKAMPENIRIIFDIMQNTIFLNEHGATDRLNIIENQQIPFTQSLYTAMSNNQSKVMAILQATDDTKGAKYLSDIVRALSENDALVKEQLANIKNKAQ